MKRFISGAICPKCKETDSIYILSNQDSKQYYCISCGFSSQQIDVAKNQGKSNVTGKKNNKSNNTKYDIIRIITPSK